MDEMLNREQVMTLFHLSKGKYAKWVADGTLPKPILRGKYHFFFKTSIDKTIELLRRRSETGMAKK